MRRLQAFYIDKPKFPKETIITLLNSHIGIGISSTSYVTFLSSPLIIDFADMACNTAIFRAILLKDTAGNLGNVIIEKDGSQFSQSELQLETTDLSNNYYVKAVKIEIRGWGNNTKIDMLGKINVGTNPNGVIGSLYCQRAELVLEV